MHTRRMKQRIGGQQLQYLLRKPLPRANSSKAPLLLFLHGAGERGTDLRTTELHGPSNAYGEAAELGRSFLLTPQCPVEHWWRSDTLYALLQEVLYDYADEIDDQRLYVTGLSMGGYGTWKLITDYPGIFSGAIPVCGGGDPASLLVTHSTLGSEGFDYEAVRQIRRTRIWAFHGTADPVVPVSESRRLVEILQSKAYPDVKLTEYPGVGHDAWTETYANPEIYTWLYQPTTQFKDMV